MKNILTLLCFFFLSISSYSQEYEKNVSGNVIIEGSFNASVKIKPGTMYIYELKGNDEYILDSTLVKGNSFSFKNKSFQTGVYRLAFNNSTNSLDIVVNPRESNKISVKLNNYRISKGYNIPNSIENKIKKLYTTKESSITQKIKLLKKSSKTRDVKLAEMKSLQMELFEYGLSLHNENPGTYFGMILSQMHSKHHNVAHLYFTDIDFSDECIVRSALLPTRIQTYFQ